MKAAHILVALFAVSSPAISSGTDEPAPKSHMKDVLKARIAQDARKSPVVPAPTEVAKPATAATDSSTKPADAVPATPPATQDEKKSDPNQSAAKAPATVMPKVEVKKGRITVLDQKLAEQEKEIARERKNLKASEVDTALNDAKIARPLAIFGGDSAQYRQRVAAERVELMEAEKDLIEAIAHARTKEEKQELQKQLDELKAMRRQLDKSLR